MLKAAVITVSDRASAGVYEDLSGPAIVGILQEEFGSDIEVSRKVVPDEEAPLTAALDAAAGADIILTTGGTGLGPRDITPEVCRAWCGKDVPGIAEAIRIHSLSETPHAMLSRGYSGIRGGTLVITLPGSVKAVTSCTKYLLPVLPHAVKMMAGGGHG